MRTTAMVHSMTLLQFDETHVSKKRTVILSRDMRYETLVSSRRYAS